MSQQAKSQLTDNNMPNIDDINNIDDLPDELDNMTLDDKKSNDEKVTDVKTETKQKCNICFDETVCQYDCEKSHTYCNKCLRKYIINSYINKKFIFRKPYNEMIVKCPDPECKKKFLINKYVSEALYNLHYINNKLKSSHDAEFKPSHCPTPDCEGELVESKCLDCKTEICTMCMNTKHEGDCSQEDLNAISVMIEHGGKDINICPSCKILLFRREGCNTFFCWNCSVYFDWTTGSISKITQKFDKRENYYKTFREHMKAAKTDEEKKAVFTKYQRGVEG